MPSVNDDPDDAIAVREIRFMVCTSKQLLGTRILFERLEVS